MLMIQLYYLHQIKSTMYFDQKSDLLAPLHYHKEFELTVVTKGNVKVQLENETYILGKGEGVFINSGLIHFLCQRKSVQR